MFKSVLLNDNRIVYFIKIEWKGVNQMILFLNIFP